MLRGVVKFVKKHCRPLCPPKRAAVDEIRR